MVAARMANLKWGQRSDRVEGQICLSKAAQLLGVGERSVKSARVVLERGSPELREAVVTADLLFTLRRRLQGSQERHRNSS